MDRLAPAFYGGNLTDSGNVSARRQQLNFGYRQFSTDGCRCEAKGAPMPRYFFNVHDGRSAPDREGTELPDTEIARAQAVRLSGEILPDAGV